MISECLVSDPEADYGEICSLPLHPMSCSGPLPAGHVFTAISRIRSTVNKYTESLCEIQWFETFKVATVQAVERRLANHEHNIVGQFHSDVELGFKQLRCRLKALLPFHKAILSWNASKFASTSRFVLPHYDVLKL